MCLSNYFVKNSHKNLKNHVKKKSDIKKKKFNFKLRTIHYLWNFLHVFNLKSNTKNVFLKISYAIRMVISYYVSII